MRSIYYRSEPNYVRRTLLEKIEGLITKKSGGLPLYLDGDKDIFKIAKVYGGFYYPFIQKSKHETDFIYWNEVTVIELNQIIQKLKNNNYKLKRP